MRLTQALLGRRRNFALTTKQGSHNFYKGTRTGSMGAHTKWGGYIVNFDKVRTYVVPEGLEYFKLTPFVTRVMKPNRRNEADGTARATGDNYLNRWKKENGED